MRFLIDSMLPPRTAEHLNALGHDAVTPTDLGAHNLPDGVLIDIATAEGYVIVTENASDFGHAATCPVVLVRKSWWPSGSLAAHLATALDRWSTRHTNPGPWARWMDSGSR